MVSSGISDKIQVLEETTYGDGGAAGEVVLGSTQKFDWKVETSSQKIFGLECSGIGGSHNVDGVMAVTGSHEFLLTDGRALKAILGSTPVNTGGSYTLDVTNALPSYSVKVVDDSADSKRLIISGLKYTTFSIQLSLGEPITISADWIAKSIDDQASDFTPTCPTVEPLVYLDAYFGISGTEQTGVENLTIDINRNVQPKRFIENTTTGKRRLITNLIEGNLDVTFNGAMTAKRSIIEEVWGGSSVTDVRTDKDFSFVADRGDTNMTLTLSTGRVISLGRTLEKTQEVSLVEFSGNVLDISGTGSYE